MALFPQGLSQVDQRCNAGERRVLHQLKRCLEDDYIVWHDIPIGPRARQPDFIILSPRWGVLLLEVKDWKRSTLAGGNRDAVTLATPRGRITEPHPLRQARDVALELVDLMRADPALVHAAGAFAGKLLFPYGWGVVMARLTRAEVAGTDFDELFAPQRTLLRDDLAADVEPMAFQHRLWGLFTVSYPHTLTLPQRDRIRWHLFPEVRLPTQAELAFDAPAGAAETGAPPRPIALPSLMQVMDLQQEQVARALGEGHRVIHGAAGSGKTMILIFRAQYLAALARPEAPILVMCFNRTLAQRIEAMLRQRGVDERVQVRTFHSWCQDMVRSYQLAVPGGLKGEAYFAALAQVLERALESGRVPGGQYTALMIDEAHDFEDSWLRMATRLVSPATNSLLVLYDDTQSIYQKRRRRFNFASVGIDARGRTSILKLNYRNTAEVLALAVQCASTLLATDGAADGAAADGAGHADGQAAAHPEDAARMEAANGGAFDRGAAHGEAAQRDSTASEAAAEAPTDSDGRLARVAPASAGRHGPLPVLLLARDAAEEATLLATRIRALVADGVGLGDIAVLCRTRAQMAPIAQALRQRQLPLQSMHTEGFTRFDWKRPCIKLLTLHSAKGLEFGHVFVAGLQALPLRDETLDEALRLLYVAMTRATQALVLSAHGASPVVERVQLGLRQLARAGG